MVVRYMKNGTNERKKRNEKDIDLLLDVFSNALFLYFYDVGIDKYSNL